MTRIATTHAGSLPRSQRTADVIFARERGEPCAKDHRRGGPRRATGCNESRYPRCRAPARLGRR